MAEVEITFKKVISDYVVDEIKEILKTENFYSFEVDSDRESISFTISGNKGVDYACLDKIKAKFNENKFRRRIEEYANMSRM